MGTGCRGRTQGGAGRNGPRHAGAAFLGTLLIWALYGCGEPPLPSTEEAPTSLFPEAPTTVPVHGSVSLFPPVRTWLAEARLDTPTLPPGLSVQFTEPLQLALNDADGALGSAAVSDDGSFAADAVPIEGIVVGLGAVVDPVATLETSGWAGGTTTLIYDSRFEGMDPRTPLEAAQVHLVPTAWVEALEFALGAAALSTRAPGATSLAQAGYLVGQVVDAEGTPIAGARLLLEPAELQDGLWYPDATLRSSGGDATGPEGLFLLVHDGGDVQSLSFTLEGVAPGPPHRGVLARERGLLLRVGVPP